MKYFFDTEFYEDGKTIDLISIGIVCEDGRELYRVSTEARYDLVNDWVRANVVHKLPKLDDPAWQNRKQIASDIFDFVVRSIDLAKDKPIFWAYYADYDWIALCQLFGTMMDLPKGFPMYCMDLKQLSVMKGSPTHPKQDGDEHHALADARWNMRLYLFLKDLPWAPERTR